LRPILAAILLFFAIASQLGGYAVYLIQQRCLKEEMARTIASHLPQKELLKIQDSKNIEWEEAGKEFYVGNQFYDVVKTEKVNGVIWYYCINDKMQTNLYNDFAKSFKSNTENSGTHKSSKYHLKFSSSYFTIEDFCTTKPYCKIVKSYARVLTKELSHFNADIIIPPPNQV